MEEVFLKYASRTGSIPFLGSTKSSTKRMLMTVSMKQPFATTLLKIYKVLFVFLSNTTTFSEVRSLPRLSFPLNYLQHINAMFRKRFIYYFRHWTQFIPQLIIPVAFITLIVFGATQTPQPKDQPPLLMELKQYSIPKFPANVFLIDDPNFIPGNGSLKDLVTSTVGSLSPGVSFDVQAKSSYDEMNNAIIAEQKEQGTRAFGVHSPVGFFVDSSQFINGTGINALFNNFGLHSPGLAMSLADSLLIRKATGRAITIRVGGLLIFINSGGLGNESPDATDKRRHAEEQQHHSVWLVGNAHRLWHDRCHELGHLWIFQLLDS